MEIPFREINIKKKMIHPHSCGEITMKTMGL
jgi:hypothetical protein